jgi:hypothetical protein
VTGVDVVVSGRTGVDAVAGQRDVLDLAADLRRNARVTVEMATTEGGPRDKSGAALEIGRLVVTGVFSASTVGAIAAVLRTWILRPRMGRITVRRGDAEVVLEGATEAQVQAALDRLPEVFGDTGSEA